MVLIPILHLTFFILRKRYSFSIILSIKTNCQFNIKLIALY